MWPRVTLPDMRVQALAGPARTRSPLPLLLSNSTRSPKTRSSIPSRRLANAAARSRTRVRTAAIQVAVPRTTRKRPLLAMQCPGQQVTEHGSRRAHSATRRSQVDKPAICGRVRRAALATLPEAKLLAADAAITGLPRTTHAQQVTILRLARCRAEPKGPPMPVPHPVLRHRPRAACRLASPRLLLPGRGWGGGCPDGSGA